MKDNQNHGAAVARLALYVLATLIKFGTLDFERRRRLRRLRIDRKRDPLRR